MDQKRALMYNYSWKCSIDAYSSWDAFHSHGPQPHSKILAPETTSSEIIPFLWSILKICLLLQAMLKLTSSFKYLFSTIFAKSVKEAILQLPINIWFTFTSLRSITFTTFSGISGCATKGSNASRSISIVSSYSASSRYSSTHSESLL